MKIILVFLMFIFYIQAKEITLEEMKQESRVAFVIENVDYDEATTESKIDEIDGVESFLKDNGFKVVYLENADRAEIIRSFRVFNKKLKKNGIALFYFRGHAVQQAKINYLLPVDILADSTRSMKNVLSVDVIVDVMNKADSRLNMVVIDSVENKQFMKRLNIKKSGLAKINTLTKTDLVISSRVNSARRGQSVSQQLMSIFAQKGVSNQDGFKQFRAKNKTAFLKLSNQDFYFKLPSKLESKEDKAWKNSLKLGSIASLTAYINAYPNGKYLSKARSSISKFEVENKAKEKAKLKQKEMALAKQKALDEELKRQAALEEEQKKKEKLKAELEEKKKKEALAEKKKLEKQQAELLAKEAARKEMEALVDKNAFFLEPTMMKIASGSFNMGSNEENKKPSRIVNIKEEFLIGKYEVTNAEFNAYLEATKKVKSIKSQVTELKKPVVNVSFDDVKAYAAWLSILTGKKYRLPSEEEWEYVARAGTDTRYFWGDKDVSGKKAFWLKSNKSNAHLYAWMKTNAAEAIHAVGQKGENPWGIHDIYGNVSEWCSNVYKSDKPLNAVRGGSFNSESNSITSDYREMKESDYTSHDLGFRLVQEL